MKKTRFTAMLIVIVMTLILLPQIRSSSAQAASAMIEFVQSEETVSVSDTLTVVMTVNSSEGIDAIDAYVSYDANMIEFKSGGKYVSGSSGLIHVLAEGLGGTDTMVKFSLQFTAIGAGNCAVNLSDVAKVKGVTEAMSTSSNRLSITIQGAAGDNGAGSTLPSSITPSLSSDNKLKSLSISSGALDPKFDPEVTKYNLTVSNDVESLYFSYEASDTDAVVSFEGNEGLKDGKNTVNVVVKAPNKDIKKYVIKVTHETIAETAEREAKENGETIGAIAFEVLNKNGKVYIQNQYRFQIVDVEDRELVPAGYAKTSVLLYGVNVTAYTIANDLDSDYLLMYCEDENGNKDFYQFDRQEKSLQRYTGKLVDRVNASAKSDSQSGMTSDKYESNLSQMAIIIAILVAFCVLLLLAIISIVLKQMKSKSRKTRDELDF